MSGNTRYCTGCGARLATDNRGPACGPCQRAAAMRDAPPDVPAGFWQVDLMRDSLAGRHMGHIVRAYRRHPFHGRRQIPQGTMARWLSISQPQLSRMESGGPVTDLDRLTLCARVLGIPDGLLWFRRDDRPDPGQAGSRDPGTAPATTPGASGAGRGRRVIQALEVIGGSQLADAADGLSALVDHYSAAVCALPPAEVYEDILAVRSYANRVMDGAGRVPRRAGLTVAAGWLSCLLAVAGSDMGEHAAARAWCSDAERLSQDARHPELAAHVGLGAVDEAAAAGQAALAVSPPAWPTRVLAGKLDQALIRDHPSAAPAAAYHDQYLLHAAPVGPGPRRSRPGLDR